MKSIKEYGGNLGKSIKKACLNKGLKPIEKQYMSKGDLVVYKQESQLVGICDGFNILSPKEDGICVKKTLNGKVIDLLFLFPTYIILNMDYLLNGIILIYLVYMKCLPI